MKRRGIFTLTLVLTMGVAVALSGGEGKTIEGTLVDTKCYSMDARNVSNDHVTPKGTLPKCATACANMGIPVAILTAGGKVYTLAVPAPGRWPIIWRSRRGPPAWSREAS